MTDIEELKAIEAVKTLKYRYFHAVDGQDWGSFGAIFVEDAVMDMSAASAAGMPVPEPALGRANIVDFVRGTLQDWLTIHHGYSPLVEIQGVNEASAKWTMEDLLFRREDGGWKKFLHGYGTYHEDYVQMDGVWRYRRVKLTRSHVELF